MKGIAYEPSKEETRQALDEIYGEMKGVRPNRKIKRRKPKMDHKRKGPKGRTSPVTDFVRSLGDYMTTQEVADQLGISANYVRKLAKNDTLSAPSHVAPFGSTKVHLYNSDDLEELREFLKDRQRVYTREEYEKEVEHG